MSRGDKEACRDKQKRKAEQIEDGGGKKSGSGRGKD